MKRYDFLIVGSGINSLVCAAILARKGHSVCVLERNDRLGGCIRTEELTTPGFNHDVLSAVHPLFVTSPGYAELQEALHENGLSYANNDTPTGVLLPDGRSLLLRTSREENVRAFEALSSGDGDAYQRSMSLIDQNAGLIFGLLGGELWKASTAKLLLSQAWKNGLHPTSDFFGEAMQTCRGWLEDNFESDLLRALLAPWILHTGLGTESAFSGLMGRLIPYTLEQVGNPVVEGGSYRLVEAFEKIILAHGGSLQVNADVTSIMTSGGKAIGVQTADGSEYFGGKAVICNVTPTQLYQDLLSADDVPVKVLRQAGSYRYGRGDMQIHLALDAPPQWSAPELEKVTMLHLTSGLDSISRAVNEADRGLLPDDATIVVAQPTAVDPSRAPDGNWVLWIQLQELPRSIKGDQRGEIVIPPDGHWNEAVREQYADRIVDRLAAQIPNFKDSIVGRKVISPADLASINVNLVGGDPYSGECSIDQFMFWRPLRATKDHQTPVKNLYHIGASTHPGPGLGGVSGYLVAKALG
jgi:phytoene dehydrogenase-like protein